MGTYPPVASMLAHPEREGPLVIRLEPLDMGWAMGSQAPRPAQR